MLKKYWSVGMGWTSLHVHPQKYTTDRTHVHAFIKRQYLLYCKFSVGPKCLVKRYIYMEPYTWIY